MARDKANLESERLQASAGVDLGVVPTLDTEPVEVRALQSAGSSLLSRISGTLRGALGALGLSAQVASAIGAGVASMPKDADADSMVIGGGNELKVYLDLPDNPQGEYLEEDIRFLLSNANTNIGDIDFAENGHIIVSHTDGVTVLRQEGNQLVEVGSVDYFEADESKVVGNFVYTNKRAQIHRFDVNDPEGTEEIIYNADTNENGVYENGILTMDVTTIDNVVNIILTRREVSPTGTLLVHLQENGNGEFTQVGTGDISDVEYTATGDVIEWAGEDNFHLMVNGTGTLYYGQVSRNASVLDLDFVAVDEGQVDDFATNATTLASVSYGEIGSRIGFAVKGQEVTQYLNEELINVGTLKSNGSNFDVLARSIGSPSTDMIGTIDPSTRQFVSFFEIETEYTSKFARYGSIASNSAELEYPIHSGMHIGPEQEGVQVIGSPNETEMTINVQNPTSEMLDAEVNDPNAWLTLLSQVGSQNEHTTELNIGEKDVLITAFGTKYTLDIDKVDGQYFLVITILDDGRPQQSSVVAEGQEAVEGTSNTEIRIPLGTIEQIKPDISSGDDDDSTPLGNDDDSEAGDDDTVVVGDDDDTGGDDNVGGCSVIDGKTFKAPNPVAAFLLTLLAKSRRKRK